MWVESWSLIRELAVSKKCFVYRHYSPDLTCHQSWYRCDFGSHIISSLSLSSYRNRSWSLITVVAEVENFITLGWNVINQGGKIKTLLAWHFKKVTKCFTMQNRIIKGRRHHESLEEHNKAKSRNVIKQQKHSKTLKLNIEIKVCLKIWKPKTDGWGAG